MAPYAPFADQPLPVAEAAAAQVLSLPMYPHLDPEDVAYVAQQVNRLARVRRSA
jgi:dTDP-4-amino-4,6-dideoxygalactose transaminase